MTLDKAIVGLEDLLTDDPHFDPELRREAVKLGIEAIKRYNQLNAWPHDYSGGPLPGETKD